MDGASHPVLIQSTCPLGKSFHVAMENGYFSLQRIINHLDSSSLYMGHFPYVTNQQRLIEIIFSHPKNPWKIPLKLILSRYFILSHEQSHSISYWKKPEQSNKPGKSRHNSCCVKRNSHQHTTASSILAIPTKSSPLPQRWSIWGHPSLEPWCAWLTRWLWSWMNRKKREKKNMDNDQNWILKNIWIIWDIDVYIYISHRIRMLMVDWC